MAFLAIINGGGDEMSRIKPPVFTGENFAILNAERQAERWHVTARIGGKTRSFCVLGPEENILKALGKQVVTPFELHLLKQNLKG